MRPTSDLYATGVICKLTDAIFSSTMRKNSIWLAVSRLNKHKYTFASSGYRPNYCRMIESKFQRQTTMFSRMSISMALRRMLSYVRGSRKYTMAAIVSDLRVSQLSAILENMAVAYGISILSCLQAETHPLPV